MKLIIETNSGSLVPRFQRADFIRKASTLLFTDKVLKVGINKTITLKELLALNSLYTSNYKIGVNQDEELIDLESFLLTSGYTDTESRVIINSTTLIEATKIETSELLIDFGSTTLDPSIINTVLLEDGRLWTY